MDQPYFPVNQAKCMRIGHKAAERTKNTERFHIQINRIAPVGNISRAAYEGPVTGHAVLVKNSGPTFTRMMLIPEPRRGSAV